MLWSWFCRQLNANSQKRLSLLFSLAPLLLCTPAVVHADWVQQQSGTTANLSKVIFIDPQTGWAAGDSSLVLRTTDGGDLWIRSVFDTVLGKSEALWFYDSNLGWVADSNGLYKTTDGGVHWRFILHFPYGRSCRDLVFITPQKGWAAFGDFYGGYLYYSTDGGETWALQDSNSQYSFRKISFADTLFGWVAVGWPGAWRQDSGGYMKQTTDGGITWQNVCYSNALSSDVQLFNRNYAWCSLYILWWYLGTPQYDGGFSKTTDGGVHWTRIMTRIEYDINAFSLVVVDTLKGFVLINNSNVSDLLGTSDGGTSWSNIYIPGFKRNICFVDSQNGWIVGDQGLIYHTSDGGMGVLQEPSPSRLMPSASHLSVSPNPFTSFATIPGHSSERFALYDISGRKVGVFKGDRIGFDLSAGVYFLKAEGMDTKPLRVVKLR